MTRQPDFSTDVRPGRTPAWERLALIAGLLAVALAAGSAWRTREEARSAHERLATVRREVEAKAARLRALEALSGRANLRLARAEAAREAEPQRIVAGVAGVLPVDARLERLSIEYGPEILLEIQVVARDAAAWDRLLVRLERAPRFRGVETGAEEREGEVRSVVRARWVGEPR